MRIRTETASATMTNCTLSSQTRSSLILMAPKQSLPVQPVQPLRIVWETGSVKGDIAYAREQRGWLEYTFDTLATGSFRFDVTGGQNNAYSDECRFDLVLYIDGQRLDSGYLEAGYGESDTETFFLPHLFAGSHTLRIEWINGVPGTSLRLDSVSLVSLGGKDTNGNGIVDWLDSRMAATSDFDETTVYTSISPYTLEGSTTHVSLVSVISDYEPNPAKPQTISVQQGLQGDYFAHIDLAPNADTTVSVSEQMA